MVAIVGTIIVLGLVVLIWLFILHRSIAKLQAMVLDKLPALIPDDRRHKPEGEPTAMGTSAPVPRQIIHDLNNLLGTMGGFADAALEDLSDKDPIRRDLAEISEAAERAKGVVKQLYSYTPAKTDTGTTGHRTEVKKTTDSYERPAGGRSYPFERNSSYPPVAKPVPKYRQPSYPPMARPVSTETGRSSAPPSPNTKSTDVDKRTSSFPAPKMTTSEEVSRFRATGGPPETVESPAKTASPTKGRLMIVDDELQLLTMFKRVFEPQGYSVTTFSDSIDALEDFKANKEQYDLAILDQRMPEMSGSILATQMIDMRSDFPIILLTGYSETVSPEDAARIGIRKYLSKPIPQAKLSAVIKGILEESTAV